MDIPRENYFKKEIDVVISRSYGPGRYDPNYEERGNDYPYAYVRFTEKRNMQAFLGMISNKQVNITNLISHEFNIDDAPEAYELINGLKTEPYMGILLKYSNLDPNNFHQTSIVKEKRVMPSDKISISFSGAGNYATATLLPMLKENKNINLNRVVTASGRTAEAATKQFNFNSCSSILMTC